MFRQSSLRGCRNSCASYSSSCSSSTMLQQAPCGLLRSAALAHQQRCLTRLHVVDDRTTSATTNQNAAEPTATSSSTTLPAISGYATGGSLSDDPPTTATAEPPSISTAALTATLNLRQPPQSVPDDDEEIVEGHINGGTWTGDVPLKAATAAALNSVSSAPSINGSRGGSAVDEADTPESLADVEVESMAPGQGWFQDKDDVLTMWVHCACVCVCVHVCVQACVLTSVCGVGSFKGLQVK